MAFITYNQLTRKVPNLLQQSTLRKSAETSQGKTVFLSHSTKDHEYVPGVIQLFSECDASTYVDDGDKRLPASPSHTTADILKRTIKQCPRFVVLVSPNSHSSHWIPWELGLADAYKTVAPVAILPIGPTSNEEAWAKTEYLGLYPRIVSVLDNLTYKYYVYDPRKGEIRWTLASWLKSEVS